MNKKILKIVISLIIVIAVTAPTLSLTFAANGDADSSSSSSSSSSEGDIIGEEPQIPKPDSLPGPAVKEEGEKVKNYFTERLLPTLTRGIIASAGGFAFVMLIIGGIRYLTAYGNEEQQSAAKNTIIWAVVGLLIATLSYAIVSIIVSLVT